MITGENGILKYGKTSAEKYAEESARERLEIRLGEMQTEKIINSQYNENEYLTEQLSKVGFGVIGDIVIVDEWQFQIDRSVPKIIVSLGKGIRNEQIKLELSQEVSADYTKSVITIKVTATEELKSIVINGEEITDLEGENGVYTIIREVTENSIYSIVAKDKNDNYNNGTIKVTEITEDMDIWNKEDLVAFREKVNSGATFEGKTVRVMADININEEQYTIGEEGVITFEQDAEQWIPIGNYDEDTTLKFSGTLEGNNHKIKGLYIENDKNYQGLFGWNEGTIKDLTIEEGYIKGTATNSTLTGEQYSGSAYIGAITGVNVGGEILNCTNKITIEGNTITGGIVGYNSPKIDKENKISNCTNEGTIISIGNGDYKYAGGIVGTTEGVVENCINRGQIKSIGTSSNSSNHLGGIVAYSDKNITNCQNYGEILQEGNGVYVYIGGIVAIANGEVSNCINKGNITNNGITSSGNVYTGGIAGLNKGGIIECNNTKDIISMGLGTSIYTGGIAGYNNASTIKNSHNTGIISSSGNGQYVYTAGIVGINSASSQVNICTNTGKITNPNSNGSTYNYVAGIVGNNNSSTINNCINKGEIINEGNGQYLRAAGITAMNFQSTAILTNSSNEGIISNQAKVTVSGGLLEAGGIAGYNNGSKIHSCFNTGSVTNTGTGTKYIGAVVARNETSTVSYCYYLSGSASSAIEGTYTTGATVKLDTEMKSEAFVTLLNSLRQEGYLEWVKTNTYPTFQ